MRNNQLGHLYRDGEVLFRKGDSGDCMYQVQRGCIEVLLEPDAEVIRTLRSGELFGEMSLFTGEPRSATVRSRGESRVLTIDKDALMVRLKVDPVLAFRILENLCTRLHRFDHPVHES